ncbi:MAG: hypothetical protein V6Z86_07385 [Hyphomicrobiales bacterium]
MKSWPKTLPQKVNREDYASSVPDGRLISKMEGGPAKLRRRFSYRPRLASCSCAMDRGQLQTLRRFIDDDLEGGVLPFRFPAIDEDGIWTVRLGRDLPSWRADGVRFRVELQLVILS